MTPEEKIAQLERRIEILEQEQALFRIGRTYQFNRDLNIWDAHNISLGTTTGTKIGTSATQKIGMFGVTPNVQYGAISAPSGGAVVDTQARDKISLVILALKQIGIVAT